MFDYFAILPLMSSTGVLAFCNIVIVPDYNPISHFYRTPVKLSIYIITGVEEGSVVAEGKDAVWSSWSPTF